VSSETVVVDEENTQSKVVLSVSNYHFNRSAQTLKRKLKCTPNDCKVSIKFSSDTFKTKKAGVQEYYFDKGGLQVNYPAFLQLLTDDYSKTLWECILRHYKERTGVDLRASLSVGASKTTSLLLPLCLTPPPLPTTSRPSSPVADSRRSRKRKGSLSPSNYQGPSRNSRKNKSNLILDDDNDDDNNDEAELDDQGDHRLPPPPPPSGAGSRSSRK